MTVSDSSSNKVESLIKKLTNMDEIEYWCMQGKMDSEITLENKKKVSYIATDNLKENCILQNEFVVNGQSTIAVPFIIRSYKKTGFKKEKI